LSEANRREVPIKPAASLRAVRLEETLNLNTSVTTDYRVIVNYTWVFKDR